MRKLLCGATGLLLSGTAHATIFQWDGGGAGNDWATDGNWNSVGSPSSTDEGWIGVSAGNATVDVSGDIGTSGSPMDRVILGPSSNTSASTLNINSGTLYSNNRFYLNFTGGAGTRSATLNIASGAGVTLSGGADFLLSPVSTTATLAATVNSSGNLVVADELFVGGAASGGGAAANSTMNVNLASGSTTTVGNYIYLSDLDGQTSTLDVQSGATLDFGGGANRRILTGRGDSTITLANGSTVTDSSVLFLGWRSNGAANVANATLNLNGGTVTTNPHLWAAYGGAEVNVTAGDYAFNSVVLGFGNGSSDAVMNQSAGTVNTSLVELSRNGGAATYNLDGGTLRTNTILENAGGVFNWGDGTLTTREVNAGAFGTTDVSSLGFQTVESGTTINVTGSIDGSASSALNLNGIYINNGTRFDQLAISGALTLTGGSDALLMQINPYLLRPNIGLAIETGSIPLVTTGTGLTGTFDIGPTYLQDNIGWAEYTGTFTDVSDLTRNTYYLEYTADDIIFHYNVEGTVPEPGTAGLVLLGMALVRGMRKENEPAFS